LMWNTVQSEKGKQNEMKWNNGGVTLKKNGRGRWFHLK
jgi:hypothetical protein